MNHGSFTIQNGGNANFTTATDFENTGTLTVGAGTTLTIFNPGSAATYTQTAGTTDIAGTLIPQGSMNLGGMVTVSGGLLEGTGTMASST